MKEESGSVSGASIYQYCKGSISDTLLDVKKTIGYM